MRFNFRSAHPTEITSKKAASSRRLVIRSVSVACRHQKLLHDMLGFHYDGGGSHNMTSR